MMIDEQKMAVAFQAYMRNDYHKTVYENAPSEACRRYYRYHYYYCKYYDPDAPDADEFIRMIREPENDLNVEDWVYISRHCGNNPYQLVCKERIKALLEKEKRQRETWLSLKEEEKAGDDGHEADPSAP